MSRLLQDKVAAITGGVTGIGRAIALEYRRQGAKVAVNFLDDTASWEHAASLRSEMQSISGDLDSCYYEFAGDISDPDVARRFVTSTAERFGNLHVVVSNAGIARFHEFLSSPDDLIRDHVRVNIQGSYYVTRAAGQCMRDLGTRGSIIGMASISGLTGSGELVHYTLTKAAVLNLMQSSAVALGKYGIRCNALLPGTIHSQLNREDLGSEQRRRSVESRTCLGRIGEPDDVRTTDEPAVQLCARIMLTECPAHSSLRALPCSWRATCRNMW
ncbi:hypothetical protein VTK73DRAFT_1286 [Phialemonium thermophilum]|uniref:Uncharacterized protein n=1 Tax=Phialemonium thermophilum TaxID=223376 RepID=A0ABR3VTP1_9PEZI